MKVAWSPEDRILRIEDEDGVVLEMEVEEGTGGGIEVWAKGIKSPDSRNMPLVFVQGWAAAIEK